jgi:hypothetical protein
MITAPEYRRLAEECFRLACQSETEPVRAAYLDLARLSGAQPKRTSKRAALRPNSDPIKGAPAAF